MTQDEALAILESGRSVLLTGAAGTGKTYTLNKFIRRAKKRGVHVAITATTGLAATHLNGTTIHAWSGIGVNDALDEHIISRISKGRKDLICKADVLIIDEISMLHDFRLDMVDEILRGVRENEAPFGGMQVVLCGDFFQLPPVNRADSKAGGFIISSKVWQKNVFTVCYLEKQYRQSEDEAYTQILNGIRAGFLTRNQLNALQARTRATPDPFTPQTHLLTVNVDVDVVNNRELDQLPGEAHEYEMETHGSRNYVEQLQRSCLALPTLRLKLGSQVMCIKNANDRRYVNGSLGVITGFEKLTDYPIVELLNGHNIVMRPDSWELMDGDKRRAQLMQVPLRLAWAITVHKSQGMTLDAARIDLSRAFVEGMGYVALSRVKSLSNLLLDGLNGMALRVSPLAKQIDAELRSRSTQALQENADYIAQWNRDDASGEHESVAVEHNTIVDQGLLETLQSWRTKNANEQHLPPYVIADNKALEGVARIKPQDRNQLLGIAGFGPKRVDNYGEDILRIVQEWQPPEISAS